MKKRILLVVVICLESLFLVSCKPSLQNLIGDGGLVSEETCSPPCLWGIVPGETTENQATEIFTQKGISDLCKIDNRYYFLVCENSLYISYDTNRNVESIYFYPTDNITVKEIVDRNGSPSAVEVIYDVTSTPEHNFFDMRLYYDEISTVLELERQETWPSYVLEKNTRVISAKYQESALYAREKAANEYLANWHGYGSYQDTTENHK
jgi:hypothetical protein